METKHGAGMKARFEFDQSAMANSVHCYGHVLRMALACEVDDQRKKVRVWRTWNKQVEEESVKVGLSREDALCRSKWIFGDNQIATRLSQIRSLSLVVDTTRFKPLASVSMKDRNRFLELLTALFQHLL